MSSSGERKRKLQRNKFRNQTDFFKRPRYDEQSAIINRVRSQNGLRGQLVLFQSSLDMPYTVLQNAVDRINGTLTIRNIGKNASGTNTFNLVVNNEILTEGSYESINEAKKGLAELALSNLRRSCFTIFRKVHPRNSPKIDLALPGCSNSSNVEMPHHMTSTNMARIGAKIMLQMGWSGGGLGAKEQGCTSIIHPYIQIQRQGLGTKNIVQEVTKVLQDYAFSRDINCISFSPDFTKEERVVIHEVARKLNLKSRSYGKDSDRILVVQSKVKPWDLIYSLLETGGESEQLKLILPTDFDK